ncbi:hypothetical protein EDD18DRAFT_768445 [Armillaria luteobubalina]|uniref:Uncharacterized protein n=1 Tax=Armillaria luteobubalina TaxID=153913 RepID=A0AA39UK34_9AGAR|nr:hypothetical protein EDD18DRAFT_768445 [Armillaria luteobubalina]
MYAPHFSFAVSPCTGTALQPLVRSVRPLQLRTRTRPVTSANRKVTLPETVPRPRHLLLRRLWHRFSKFMIPSVNSAFFICIIARNSVISCWASLLFRVELYAERTVIEAVFSVIGIQNIFRARSQKIAARAGLTSCRMFTMPLKPEQKNFPGIASRFVHYTARSEAFQRTRGAHMLQLWAARSCYR